MQRAQIKIVRRAVTNSSKDYIFFGYIRDYEKFCLTCSLQKGFKAFVSCF